MTIGDPALDVAHFRAHLPVLADRQTDDFAAYDAQGERFLTTYQHERPQLRSTGAHRSHRAYTFLKLAATEAQRARDGWRETTGLLAELAWREVGRLPL